MVSASNIPKYLLVFFSPSLLILSWVGCSIFPSYVVFRFSLLAWHIFLWEMPREFFFYFLYESYLMFFHWSLSKSRSPQVSRILLSIWPVLMLYFGWSRFVLRFPTLSASFLSLWGRCHVRQLQLIPPLPSCSTAFFHYYHFYYFGLSVSSNAFRWTLVWQKRIGTVISYLYDVGTGRIAQCLTRVHIYVSISKQYNG